MKRRTMISMVGATLWSTTMAGCLDADTGADDRSPSPTSSPSPTPTSSPSPTPTEAPPSTESNDPDPDLPIHVENRHDATHTIALTVTRESGETVHEETYEVTAGADREVYNLDEADPDGVESFEIEATMDDRTASATVETSSCYGEAIVAVSEDGELHVTYSIC